MTSLEGREFERFAGLVSAMSMSQCLCNLGVPVSDAASAGQMGQFFQREVLPDGSSPQICAVTQSNIVNFLRWPSEC